MKKLVTRLFFGIAMMAAFQADAQYCGSSQVNFPACGIQTTDGFGDINTYPCIIKGQCDSLIIPFKVYSSFTVGSTTVSIYKLRIHSLDSLPCGLCWSTSTSSDANNVVNEFDPNESGCIKITGFTNDNAGQYLLSLYLDVRTSPATNAQEDTTFDTPDINSQAGQIAVWVKVANSVGSCPDTVITSQGSAHPSTSCTQTTCPILGINQISHSLTELNIQPSPMSTDAKVTFSSENGGAQVLRITDMEGRDVYQMTMTAKPGYNETVINRNNLPAGIYILSVGDEQGTATRKFTIDD